MNELISGAAQLPVLLLGVWLALALLGLKWRWFKSVRRNYSKLIKTLAVAVATWLWISPRIEKEGIGQAAQARLTFDEDTYYDEDDSWA